MSDSDDHEARVDRLRRSLEDWKEILVVVKGVLDWDQPFHPGVIFGVVTLDFLLLWWLEPTVVALTSLTLLVLAVADMAAPFLAPKIIPVDAWGSRQQHEFNVVCETIVGLGSDTCEMLHVCRDLKAQRPRVYLALSVVALLSTAWLGSTLGDLFMLYLIVLGFALYPGAKRHGIVESYFGDISTKVKDVIFKPKER